MYVLLPIFFSLKIQTSSVLHRQLESSHGQPEAKKKMTLAGLD